MTARASRRTAKSAAIRVAVLLLLACNACNRPIGGDAVSGGPTTGLPTYTPGSLQTPAGLCATFSDAECSSMVSCGSVVDKQTCLDSVDQQRFVAECEAQSVLPIAAIAAGGIAVDWNKVASCIGASATCGSSSYAWACFDLLLQPKRPAGAPCRTDQECLSGSCGTSGSYTCPATCHGDSTADGGGGQAQCQVDTDCADQNYRCTAGTCLFAPLPDGAPCDAWVICAGRCESGVCRSNADLLAACPKLPGESCVIENVSCGPGPSRVADVYESDVQGGSEDASAPPPPTPDKCTASYIIYVNQGGDCSSEAADAMYIRPKFAEPVRRLCKVGLRCDADAHVCQPALPAGAACGGAGDCRPTRECSSISNTCAALGTEGQPCETACRAPALRDGNAKRCVVPRAEGVPCASGSACLSGGCINGKCAPACLHGSATP